MPATTFIKKWPEEFKAKIREGISVNGGRSSATPQTGYPPAGVSMHISFYFPNEITVSSLASSDVRRIFTRPFRATSMNGSSRVFAESHAAERLARRHAS